MKTVRAGAFTIVDLLAVLAIIGLPGFLFLPVWLSNGAQAHETVCRDNLRIIGQAGSNYAAENQGRFPGCQHGPPSWVESLADYGGEQTFLCALHKADSAKKGKWTYALNDFLTPNPYGARHLDFSRVASVPSPGETMMFGEAAEAYRIYDHFHFGDALDNGFTPGAFAEQVDVERHDGRANYLFVDGHVALLGWSGGAKPRLQFTGSRFVHPGGESSAQQMARR